MTLQKLKLPLQKTSLRSGNQLIHFPKITKDFLEALVLIQILYSKIYLSRLRKVRVVKKKKEKDHLKEVSKRENISLKLSYPPEIKNLYRENPALKVHQTQKNPPKIQ